MDGDKLKCVRNLIKGEGKKTEAPLVVEEAIN